MAGIAVVKVKRMLAFEECSAKLSLASKFTRAVFIKRCERRERSNATDIETGVAGNCENCFQNAMDSRSSMPVFQNGLMGISPFTIEIIRSCTASLPSSNRTMRSRLRADRRSSHRTPAVPGTFISLCRDAEAVEQRWGLRFL